MATRPPSTETTPAAVAPGTRAPAPEVLLLEAAALEEPLPLLLPVSEPEEADVVIEPDAAEDDEELTMLAMLLAIVEVVEHCDDAGIEYAAVGVAWSGEPLTNVYLLPLALSVYTDEKYCWKVEVEPSP